MNQPNRWAHWIGSNIVAFIATFAALQGGGVCIIMLNFLIGPKLPHMFDWIDVPSLLPELWIGIAGLLTGLSAMVGSMAQRDGLDKLVLFWPWSLKTGLITTLISWASLAIFMFIVEPHIATSSHQALIRRLYFIASIALIALATALAQLSEVKKSRNALLIG